MENYYDILTTSIFDETKQNGIQCQNHAASFKLLKIIDFFFWKGNNNLVFTFTGLCDLEVILTLHFCSLLNT